jgi:hypothetical protein
MSTTLARVRVTDRIMVVTAHTDPVTLGLAMATQAASQSRLAIGHIIIAALVTMLAGPTMSGGRDIGHGGAAKESGSTATTL